MRVILAVVFSFILPLAVQPAAVLAANPAAAPEAQAKAAGSAATDADWAKGLQGLDEAGLAAPARALLGRNGFVLVPSGESDIADIYVAASRSGQPAFVTTDAVLHTGHIFFDYLLRILETDKLYAKVESLTDSMLALSAAQYKQAADPDLKEAARLNIGFFAVAKALLSPGYKPGYGLDGLVNDELANIAAHSGLAFRKLLTYVKDPNIDKTPYAYEDYSQYVPRGHYTRNARFERYFKAMMWYGRIDFKLLGVKDPDGRRDGRMMTLQALLMADALSHNPGALRLWRQIYEPTVYFVGKTDDLTVDDYAALSKEIFPGSGVERFADRARQAEFRRRAVKLRGPKILSGAGGGAAGAMGFRFMGQRFIPDSYMFQELVFGAAGLNGSPPNFHFTGEGEPFTMEDLPGVGKARAFPRGLDIMAVLGSKRAHAILKREGDTAYVSYEAQLSALSEEYAATPPAEWKQNLYWRWLHALLPLLRQHADKAPQAFLASPEWVDKDLQTALGSWTELRHDTILYAKQSYTAISKSINFGEPQMPYGYVEPAPEVYGRLAAMFKDLNQHLQTLGLAIDEVPQKLSQFEALLGRLKAISNRELAGQPLTDGDYSFIDSFGGALKGLVAFPYELMKRITSGTDNRMDVVADVHTEPNSGQVLEEAVGSPANIYVRVRDDRGYRLCRGGVFTYYEFKHPMADRLTDEAWQKMGAERKRPSPPSWAQTIGG